MAEREQGTIKWYSDLKGYGVIKRESGKDLFVHHSALREKGFTGLREGDRVEYAVVEGFKKLHAAEVVIVGRGAGAQPEADAPTVTPLGERETGTVKWFSVSKGYGFIKRPHGGDAFFHQRDLRGEGFRILLGGDHVEFEVVKDLKGPQAQDVVVV